ncbi:hypothetical protein ANME2D_00531 [Candidatus Methanoperedens nitroreducens]|uniref:EfeO-type cupredoxin-like domain-containing protein n=1 Tax=Candidatus Methanoperedens nitratireducens TaxID=1392998 RepID=A0A062VAF9_9EURY|nr:cupredoxin domain-containing protein [Candidatus Methanoperedens nitroreducens]KCZ73463.1 hypothetical protein ANME2D_00531 [Candidatus Methanoperedens nitroreducens]MDJ1422581.1 cupredoxin domain-containing protein [Candidatus Methanoperedens sp.]
MVKIWVLCLSLLIAALSGCVYLETEPVTNTTVDQTPITTPEITPEFPISEPTTVYVEIKGSSFNPPEWRVIKNTTVIWKNMDSAQHIINVDDITSPPLDKRDTWNYTFNRTGTFEYSCSSHPFMPHGRIIVD